MAPSKVSRSISGRPATLNVLVSRADSPSVLRLTSHAARNVDASSNAPVMGRARWVVNVMGTSGR